MASFKLWVFPKSLRFLFPFTRRHSNIENKVFFCWHYCLFSKGKMDPDLIFSSPVFHRRPPTGLLHWTMSWNSSFLLGHSISHLFFIHSLNGFSRLIFKSELQSLNSLGQGFTKILILLLLEWKKRGL